MGLKNLFSRLNTQVWAASQPGSPEDAALAVTEPLPPLFEFIPWSKTPRLFRDIVITEKLDGTNAAVQIRRVPTIELVDHLSLSDPTILGTEFASSPDTLVEDGEYWVVGAQSRNRVISLAADNQGFAKWVAQNADTLIRDLGEGCHFGEFWGQGIGRKYGLDEKRFSLFNPAFEFKNLVRHADGDVDVPVVLTPGLSTVPVLYEGPFRESMIRASLEQLQDFGSYAAPDYMNPEGIVVYHTHARRIIGKVTLDNQDAGKWES